MKIARIFGTGIMFIMASVLLTGCASTPDADREDFLMWLENNSHKYGQAFLDEDVDMFLSIHHEDTIKMIPGMQSQVGLEEVKEGIIGYWAAFDVKKFDTVNEEIVVFGEYAYVRGSYTEEYVPDDGGDTLYYDGKYLTVYKKVSDGDWRIYRDCFNSNK
jgi:ketosteroid isomerase-like protein